MRFIWVASLFGLLVLPVVIPAMANGLSVSMGGHTFTADLPDGWKLNQSVVEPYNPQDTMNLHDVLATGAEDWTGTQAYAAFDYSSGQADGNNGWVNVFVLKPKPQWVKDNSATTKDILYHATDLFLDTNGITAEKTGIEIKDDDFNGHPAHYIESGLKNTFGVIAILLDDGNVAVMDITSEENLGSKPWDIISSTTVT